MSRARRFNLGIALLTALSATSLTLAGQDIKAPETFIANAQVVGDNAGSTAVVTIQINQYTDEKDRAKIQDALKFGGYPGFLPVLRKAPEIGFVELNGRKVIARWARQQTDPKGRRSISVVTDEPVFFVGGGDPDAKPRAGYDIAVIELDVNDIGLGTGTMAAAARVRPGGPTGVQVDDYSVKPVKLVTVRKAYSTTAPAK
jgi:hypothetical protein